MTFVDMFSILGELQKADPSVYYIRIVLFLIIFTFIISPFLVQSLIKPGPYEELLEDAEYKSFKESLQRKYNDEQETGQESETERPKSSEKKLGSFAAYFGPIAYTFFDEITKTEKRAKDFFQYGLLFSVFGLQWLLAF